MEVAKVENVTRTIKSARWKHRPCAASACRSRTANSPPWSGPSGSGKTTLLQLIGCLDQPTSGRCYINGKDVSHLNRDQRADMRRGQLGFIFQFYALIPTLSAYENVEMPLLLTNHGAAERKERVMQLLEAVGLTDRANNRPDQMSGGQQQRVAIARALATKPALILADEPTANLDTVNGEQVMEIMEKLNKETGVTFVFATHDPRVIKFANRVVTLRDGLVIENNGKGKE
jgi:putative ABC transport system ATP-binding protein